MTYKGLKDKKTGTVLFIMCFTLYLCCYFGRLNFSAALAGIVSEGTLSKTWGGTISSCFFFCYGAGQLVNGFLGDRVSPFKMISSGLFITATCNLFMVFLKNPLYMSIAWGINGFSQSMLWPPILIIFSHILSEEQSRKAYINITPSVPSGTLGAFLSSTILMRFWGWRSVFVFAAALLYIVFAAFIGVYFYAKPRLIKGNPETEKPKEQDTAEKVPLMKLFGVSGLVFTFIPVAVHGMLKDGVMTWVPAMMTEVYTLMPFFSVFLSIILPIVNLSGAYLGQYIFGRHIKDEMSASMLFFVIAVLPLSFMLLIGKIPPVAVSVLLSAVTSCMFAINYLTITLAAVRFKKYGCVSTVSGLLNGIAYLGCAVSTYAFGYIAENFGWYSTVVSWILLCAVAVFAFIPAIKLWRRFIS